VLRRPVLRRCRRLRRPLAAAGCPVVAARALPLPVSSGHARLPPRFPAAAAAAAAAEAQTRAGTDDDTSELRGARHNANVTADECSTDDVGHQVTTLILQHFYFILCGPPP